MVKKFCITILWVFSLLSIFIMIKYSDWKIITLPFGIQQIFLKPDKIDVILLDLADGYLISVLFYLLIVYFPDKNKKGKVDKIVFNELSSICINATMLLVLMYKNVCSQSEWNFKHLKDDSEFFNDKFFDRIIYFDAYKEADTLKCKISDSGELVPFSWDDLLEDGLSDLTKRLDRIMDRYIYFLDENLIDKMLSLRNSHFLVTYLGLPSNQLAQILTGSNGIKYAESIPLYQIRKSNKMKYKLMFMDERNLETFKDFIKYLLDLRELCINKKTSFKTCAISAYCIEDCGQIGIALNANTGKS